MKTFFTSDTHFGHKNIIRYTNRPFKTVRTMDEAMIANWNEVVGERDTVYHLGDLTLNDAKFVEHVFPRLNGRIKVLGYHWHHDKRWIPKGFGPTRFVSASRIPVEILQPMVVLKFKHLRNKGRPQVVVLCHYAMAKWDRGHHGSWHLYGHSHGAFENEGLSIDVGVDSHDFRPVALEEVAEIMRIKSKFPTLDLQEVRALALKGVQEPADPGEKQTDVHTEHCCRVHGCKYKNDNPDCTVWNGTKPQSFACLETSVCYELAPGFFDGY